MRSALGNWDGRESSARAEKWSIRVEEWTGWPTKAEEVV